MKVEKLKRTEGKAYAIIKCSNCLLEERYDQGVNLLTDPVDIYAMLVDAFYGEAGDKQSESSPLRAKDLVKPAEQPAIIPPVQPASPAQPDQPIPQVQPAAQVQPAQPAIAAKIKEPEPAPAISGLKVKKEKKKAKSEEKVSLADLENKEDIEITEDDLKEAYLVDEDEEILDDLKKDDKEKKTEKLPFIDEDIDDDDEDDTFK